MALVSAAARGQTLMPVTLPCMKTEDLATGLKGIGQTRRGNSTTESGYLVVFWEGPLGWTLALNLPNGMSCILATGKEWQGHIPGTDI